ncbi:MAG: hypothetical protein ACXADS_13370 [Candidatus Thorarchaeota archaeon]|jgi:hypothetical protein
MRCVGVASGIELLAPEDSYFSYFNSPYIGHKRGSSVDIYPSHRAWGGPACSPIDGKIVRVKQIAMGEGKVFSSEDRDYGIAMRPDGDSEYIVRILHCHPGVSVGQSVDRGDEIGNILRSRFFCFWTGPHYHIEVMRERDFGRSSQSSPIVVNHPAASVVERGSPAELECEVVESSSDILIGVSRRYSYVKSGDLCGHLTRVGDKYTAGILDAGVPHYSHGGVVAGVPAEVGTKVAAWGKQIGLVTSSHHSVVQFRITENFCPMVDGDPIRGISNHIYPKKQSLKGVPPVYLIPKKIGQFNDVYNKGDVFILSL